MNTSWAIGAVPPGESPSRTLRLLDLLEPEVAVLHLAVVGLQPDAARVRHLQRILQHLAVARAAGHVPLHGHDDLVPVLRLVLLLQGSAKDGCRPNVRVKRHGADRWRRVLIADRNQRTPDAVAFR